MMVNVLWSKSHGLDSVFHRVEEDNVLLPLDLQRVRENHYLYYTAAILLLYT